MRASHCSLLTFEGGLLVREKRSQSLSVGSPSSDAVALLSVLRSESRSSHAEEVGDCGLDSSAFHEEAMPGAREAPGREPARRALSQ